MAYRQTAGLGYAQPTPNVAPCVPPQVMNFNGPPQAMQGGRPFGYSQSMGGTGMMGMGAPRNAPMRSPQVGMGGTPPGFFSRHDDPRRAVGVQRRF
jgi:hypothetical protein